MPNVSSKMEIIGLIISMKLNMRDKNKKTNDKFKYY